MMQASDELSLGFDQIRELVAQYCVSEKARDMAMELRFQTDYALVVQQQEENEECRRLIQEGIQLPEFPYPDLQHFNRNLEIEGFIPENSLWPVLIRTIKDAEQLTGSLRRHMHRFPRLFALAESIEIPAELIFRLSEVFSDEGEILDRASPELNRLRKKKIDEQSRLRRKLEQSLRGSVSAGFSPDDAGITIRNGRLVIPVLAEHKRKVKGFIHDESSTGQTVFTEPEEALEANNAIREIQFAEQREIQRILLEITGFLRPFRHTLAGACSLLYRMDLIRAKSRFGLSIKSSFPGHHSGPSFSLSDARHPLLFLSHLKKNLPLVPLRIWLTEEKRVLVISGPNAGGKSVCLKTAGLLQIMWQAGLPVSAGEGSKMGFFKMVLSDIGDKQSLENDLSTYSSHLANMKRMLNECGADTLVLLDEFGNGTDPALGGPIAEAILEGLCHKKVWALVNTHYTNLKNFANRHPLCANAAMKFSAEKMEPLYQLEIGHPGSSFALEIAEKTGLSRAILNQARHKTGARKINLDQLLADLEKEKQEQAAKSQELKDREKGLRLLENEFRQKSLQLENERRAILNKAKAEAGRLAEEANRRIEEAIRQIRESQAEKSTLRLVRQSIQELKEELIPEQLEAEKDEGSLPAARRETETNPVPKIIGGEIQAGDFVRIRGSESTGRVSRIKGKMAEIELGDLLSSIRLEKLERISLAPVNKPALKTGKLNLSEKMMEFSRQLDVRGQRADEAIRQLESWLDEAILLGQNDLSILHGKGNGILRDCLRRQLRLYPQVKDIRDEHADRGGAGITLFRLAG